MNCLLLDCCKLLDKMKGKPDVVDKTWSPYRSIRVMDELFIYILSTALSPVALRPALSCYRAFRLFLDLHDYSNPVILE